MPGASVVFPRGSAPAKREAEDGVPCRSSVNSGLCFAIVNISEGTFQKEAQRLPKDSLLLGVDFHTCLCLGQIRPHSSRPSCSCPSCQSGWTKAVNSTPGRSARTQGLSGPGSQRPCLGCPGPANHSCSLQRAVVRLFSFLLFCS